MDTVLLSSLGDNQLMTIFKAIKICDNVMKIDKSVFMWTKGMTIDNVASHIAMAAIMLQELRVIGH